MTERKLIRQSALDRWRNRGIMNIEKGAADRRLASYMVIEVIADCSRVRRSLLFCDLNDQINDADDNKAKLKQLSVCDHTHPPSPHRRGLSEVSSPNREAFPPTV